MNIDGSHAPPVFFHCTNCRAMTALRVMATVVRHKTDEDVAEGDDPYSERHSFGPCSSCGRPALVWQIDWGEGFDVDTPARLYPPEERRLGFIVPPAVSDSYEEAVKCEKAQAWLAVCVMVGRTLEAICRDRLPNDPKIMVFAGLKKLRASGVISSQLVEWAEELRFLRNVGAHATSHKLDAQDARDALDFLQAILDTMYQLQPKFDAMKKRRDAKKPEVRLASPALAVVDGSNDESPGDDEEPPDETE